MVNLKTTRLQRKDDSTNDFTEINKRHCGMQLKISVFIYAPYSTHINQLNIRAVAFKMKHSGVRLYLDTYRNSVLTVLNNFLKKCLSS